MTLQLGKGVALPLDAITQTFGILAVRGAGKSNTAAVMAEEMFGAGLPFVVVDPVGSWWGLRADGAGKGKGLPIPVFGGQHGDVPLEETGGHVLADLVVDERLSCVLDVSDLSEGAKHRFLLDFATRLYQRNRDPLHLFLEEADDYIPQKPMREQARLLRAFQNIVRRGRARGLGITLITQRSAVLSKDVLTQIETLIVLRTTSPQDRKAIAGWVEYHGQAKDLLESLSGLESGEAWIWSPSWLGTMERVGIRRRRTFDSAATPRDVKGRRAPATLADVDLGAIRDRMAATIERAKATDPKELKRALVVAEREIRALQSRATAQPAPEVKRVEVPVVKPAEVKRLEAAIAAIERAEQRGKDHRDAYAESVAFLKQTADGLREQLARASGKQAENPCQPVRTSPLTVAAITDFADGQRVRIGTGKTQEVYRIAGAPSGSTINLRARQRQVADVSGNGDLSGPERRILDALAWLEAIGVDQPENGAAAFVAGYSPTSTSYTNPRSALAQRGYLEYPQRGTVRLTESGRVHATVPATMPTQVDLQHAILAKLPGPARRILEPLLAAYPDALTNEVLAEAAGYSPTSTSYTNPRSTLSTLGLIEYPQRGTVRARDLLFPEGR